MTFEVQHRHSVGGKLDVDVSQLLQAMAEDNAPLMETLTPIEARESMKRAAELSGEKISIVKTTDRTIPGPHGEIPIRIFQPPGEGPFPVLIYFHGGGWVICNIETHDPPCRQLCLHSNCMIISVGYRLAPEFKFPIANDEAYAAVHWVHDHANTINARPDKIAVGGDSAGGNMATVTALRIRNEGDIKLSQQLLIYPVVDLTNLERQSYRDYGKPDYFLSKSLIQWFLNHYLNSMEETESVYVSPLLADDLSGMPPAFIITAEFDPLRDEGELYAEKMHNAGVPVTCVRYNGMIHPFWSFGGAIKAAHNAYQEAGEFLQSMAG